jgi:dihydrofolate reductase
VVTHRPEEQPDDDFVFVGGLDEAIELAKDAAGYKQVNVMGGAQIIGQTLAAGLADQLTVVIAPLVLGAGKRLFEGVNGSLEFEHVGVRQSRFATFVEYRVKR